MQRTKKNGRPILLNSENSPKLKRLQVSEKWSSLRQTAKISLFSAIFETEKIFQLKQMDFFSETNAICPEKQLHQRLMFEISIFYVILPIITQNIHYVKFSGDKDVETIFICSSVVGICYFCAV